MAMECKSRFIEVALQQELCKMYSSEGKSNDQNALPQINPIEPADFHNVNKLELTPFLAVMRLIKLEYSTSHPEVYRTLIAVLHDYIPALGEQHRDRTVRYIHTLLSANLELADFLVDVLPKCCPLASSTHTLHSLKRPSRPGELFTLTRTNEVVVDAGQPIVRRPRKDNLKFYNYTPPVVSAYVASQGVPPRITSISGATQPTLTHTWALPITQALTPHGVVTQTLATLPVVTMATVTSTTSGQPITVLHAPVNSQLGRMGNAKITLKTEPVTPPFDTMVTPATCMPRTTATVNTKPAPAWSVPVILGQEDVQKHIEKGTDSESIGSLDSIVPIKKERVRAAVTRPVGGERTVKERLKERQSRLLRAAEHLHPKKEEDTVVEKLDDKFVRENTVLDLSSRKKDVIIVTKSSAEKHPDGADSLTSLLSLTKYQSSPSSTGRNAKLSLKLQNKVSSQEKESLDDVEMTKPTETQVTVMTLKTTSGSDVNEIFENPNKRFPYEYQITHGKKKHRILLSQPHPPVTISPDVPTRKDSAGALATTGPLQTTAHSSALPISTPVSSDITCTPTSTLSDDEQIFFSSQMQGTSDHVPTDSDQDMLSQASEEEPKVISDSRKDDLEIATEGRVTAAPSHADPATLSLVGRKGYLSRLVGTPSPPNYADPWGLGLGKKRKTSKSGVMKSKKSKRRR